MSTAADCLRIAAAGMTIPAFAEVVGMSTVTLPLVGTVHNIVTEIGTNGVVGVKSGYTSQAGGCMVLAAMATVEGRSVLVLASALGQQVPPPVAPKPTAAATKSSSPTAAPPTTTPPTTTTTVPANDLEIQYPLLYTGPVVEKLLDASEAAIVPVVGGHSPSTGGHRRRDLGRTHGIGCSWLTPRGRGCWGGRGNGW